MFTLTELLTPRYDRLWPLVKQSGVDDVVILLDGGEQDQRMFASVGAQSAGPAGGELAPWSLPSLRSAVDRLGQEGLRVVGLEDNPPLDLVRMAAPGRDGQIEDFLTMLRSMGELEIPLLCYNWMAVTSWARTNVAQQGRGGALTTAYSEQDAAALPPLEIPEGLNHQTLWSGLKYFLDAVIPVAEETGVRLAMHPDDPPRSYVRGVPRIMQSFDAFRQLLSLNPSPANAITYCQGNFALMDGDIVSGIREFGTDNRIAFVHFRDVRGDVNDFEEIFHDEGPTDMAACMRAYEDIGFEGPLRPDHVPTMAGESNDLPAYETLGRLFALGYIRGLQHGMTRRPNDREEGGCP